MVKRNARLLRRGPLSVRRLAVVGTGLIGASVGLAAKRAGVDVVTGHDSDREALAGAVARGAVDVAARSIEAAVGEAELVVLATPVRAIPGLAAAALEGSRPECTVTDVGSTKGRICSSLAGRSARFVGGHPICGSEASGPASARAELFEGATWFVVPVPKTAPERSAVVEGFVATLGAVPVHIDPDEHDRLLALVSHLPHALAYLLVAQAGRVRVGDHDPLSVAGASFRDLTRVSGANRDVWVDVFLDNADALVEALTEHREHVQGLEAALRETDEAALARWIDEAAGYRARLDFCFGEDHERRNG